jgi:hypothetical protein
MATIRRLGFTQDNVLFAVIEEIADDFHKDRVPIFVDAFDKIHFLGFVCGHATD